MESVAGPSFPKRRHTLAHARWHMWWGSCSGLIVPGGIPGSTHLQAPQQACVRTMCNTDIHTRTHTPVCPSLVGISSPGRGSVFCPLVWDPAWCPFDAHPLQSQVEKTGDAETCWVPGGMENTAGGAMRDCSAPPEMHRRGLERISLHRWSLLAAPPVLQPR